MSDEQAVPTVVIPELTAEQKLKMLLAHRAYIKAQAIFQSVEKDLNLAANELVKELGISGPQWSFDLETLTVGYNPVK